MDPNPNAISSNVRGGESKFEVRLDVEQYHPEDIRVRLVDNFLVVECEGREREAKDGGSFSSLAFIRRYNLPSTATWNDIICHVTPGGTLHITVSTSEGERKAASAAPIFNNEHTPPTTNRDPNHPPHPPPPPDPHHFQVRVDVHEFRKEEVGVRLVDNFLVLECEHEERAEEGEGTTISRQFIRRYKLPKDARWDEIQCNFEVDGVLSITLPKVPEEEGEEALPKNSTFLHNSNNTTTTTTTLG